MSDDPIDQKYIGTIVRGITCGHTPFIISWRDSVRFLAWLEGSETTYQHTELAFILTAWNCLIPYREVSYTFSDRINFAKKVFRHAYENYTNEILPFTWIKEIRDKLIHKEKFEEMEYIQIIDRLKNLHHPLAIGLNRSINQLKVRSTEKDKI